VGVVSAAAGYGVAAAFGTGHGAVYAVIMASSSAALVLPAADQLGLGGDQLLPTLAQVAVADTACIVALPLVIDPANAGRAALGLCSSPYSPSGSPSRSGGPTRRTTGTGCATPARTTTSPSSCGSASWCCSAWPRRCPHARVRAARGVRGRSGGLVRRGAHRLAKQLFAVAEGFLAPLYFVWLGASLSIAALVKDPRLVLLGLVLGVGAVLVHLALALSRQRPLWAISTSAQLGVPMAAATIGASTGMLTSGEPAALILGALVTIGALTVATALASKRPAYQAARDAQGLKGRHAQALPRHEAPSPE